MMAPAILRQGLYGLRIDNESVLVQRPVDCGNDFYLSISLFTMIIVLIVNNHPVSALFLGQVTGGINVFHNLDDILFITGELIQTYAGTDSIYPVFIIKTITVNLAQNFFGNLFCFIQAAFLQ